MHKHAIIAIMLKKHGLIEEPLTGVVVLPRVGDGDGDSSLPGFADVLAVTVAIPSFPDWVWPGNEANQPAGLSRN